MHRQLDENTLVSGQIRPEDVPALKALGVTLIVTHLGLLIWETRHVSASLAYPGLKPTGGRP